MVISNVNFGGNDDFSVQEDIFKKSNKTKTSKMQMQIPNHQNIPRSSNRCMVRVVTKQDNVEKGQPSNEDDAWLQMQIRNH